MQKILVVDDDLPVLNALNDRLTREGFMVLQAQDGEEGMVISLREHPDLILLDILMPKVDGLAMIKKLRASGDWGKAVPVIFLTNLNSDQDKIKASIENDSPADFLVKTDWSLTDVVEKIRSTLALKA